MYFKIDGCCYGEKMHSKPCKSLCEAAQRRSFFCRKYAKFPFIALFQIGITYFVIAKPVRRLVVAISKNDVFSGDCQEVNCRKAAREATLGCASVSYSSQ